MAGILWFELQNEGSISAWTFVRVHFVYVSQHFHGLWKQLYFLSSLHFKIETSLCSLWFFLPGFHSSLGRHLRNCQKQGTKSTKSWPGKQKAVKKKMRSAGVTSHCDTSMLSHLWMSVQSVSFWEPWTVERGLQWLQAFLSTAGHLATPGVHVSFPNIMEIKYRFFFSADWWTSLWATSGSVLPLTFFFQKE